ncbi:major facilitator superfamily transporter [Xylariaceae sp. AK1471]|nr:major facilitator superfamily transporter [Xylariaceae sp. AK1471]
MTEEEERRRNDSLDEAPERAPLLPNAPRRPQHRSRFSVASITSSIANVHVPKAHTNHAIINILCVIIFTASCSAGFIDLPLTRLIEDILCHHYYDVKSSDQPIDERLCKEDVIQKQLAYIIAVQTSLYAIVGIIAALPWGLAADKIGRKPIVALAMLGLLVGALVQLAVVYWRDVFPVTAIWASSAGQLIGGGNAVLLAVILSMIADATNEEDRAMAFLRTHVASLSGNLVSPSLSAIVMERFGPWVPPWIGICLFLIGGISFLFLPETLIHKGPRQDPVPDSDSTEPDSSLGPRISHVFSQFRESLSILKSPSLILLLATVLCSQPVMTSTLSFLNQFVSRRYNIKIAQTGYVQTIYGVASLIMALVILPWLSSRLVNPITPARFRAKGEQSRDLFIARWSYGVLFLGALTLSLSPTLGGFIFGLILMAIGSGFSSLTRSLMSIYVDPEHRSRLFSIVGMVEVLGSVYAQPMLAGLFSLGLKLHGGWIGLPYLGLAVLIAFAGALLLFVKIPKTHDGSSVSNRDEDGA